MPTPSYTSDNNNYLGDTPLHMAVRAKNEMMVDSLLDKQADPNQRNQDGNTPLHIAALTNNEQIVKKLLCKGSNKELKNHHQKTPQELALEVEVIALLAHFSVPSIECDENKPKENESLPSCDLEKLDTSHGLSKIECHKESASYIVPLKKENNDQFSVYPIIYNISLNPAWSAFFCDEIEARQIPYNSIIHNWNDVAQCGEKQYSFSPMICESRAHGSMVCAPYPMNETILSGTLKRNLCKVMKESDKSLPYRAHPHHSHNKKAIENIYVLGNVLEFKVPVESKTHTLDKFKNENYNYLMGLIAAASNAMTIMANGTLFKIGQKSNDTLTHVDDNTSYTDVDRLAHDVSVFNGDPSANIEWIVGIGVGVFVGGLVVMKTVCRFWQSSRHNNSDRQSCSYSQAPS